MNYKRYLFGLLVCIWGAALTAQPTFSFNGGSGDPGDTFTADLTVTNFNALISAQFTITWDPEVLEFRSVGNLTEDLNGFSAGQIGDFPANTENGRITLSWNDPLFEPNTLNGGTVLFSIEFEAVGQACDSTEVAIGGSPLRIEVLDADENEVDIVVNDGLFSIPGTDCNGGGGGTEDLVLTWPMVNASPGSNVCVPILVENFTDVNSMQFSILYDDEVLDFTGLGDINLDGFTAGNINEAGSGVLRLLWDHPQSTGQDLPDGETMVELCFDVIGATGDMGDIEFSDQPLAVEIANSSGQEIDNVLVNGKVTVVDDSDPVIFNISSATVCPEDVVSIAVTVENFTDIEGAQFSVDYDPDVLNLVEKRLPDNPLPGLNSGSFACPPDIAEGDITMLWFLPGVDPESLDDGDTLFIMDFSVVGNDGESSAVDIIGTPLPIEVSGTDGQVLQTQINTGQVSIDCSLDCSLEMIMNPECNGDGLGSIFISVIGGSGDYSFNWSDGSSDEDLIGVPPGSYTVEVTDLGSGSMTTCGPFQIEEAETVVLDNVEITDASSSGGDGAIDITVSGGTMPYSFAWSNGEASEDISDLEEDCYEVTVTDSEGCEEVFGPFCVGMEQLEVEVITSNSNGFEIACNGDSTGSIELIPQNGMAPYTYEWGNDDLVGPLQANLSAGAYSVTVTDVNGLSFMTTVTITEPQGLQVSFENICASSETQMDGEFVAEVTGGVGPYRYSWNGAAFTDDNTLDGQAAGSMATLRIRDDNNCELNLSADAVPAMCLGGAECFTGREVITPNGDELNDVLRIACINGTNNELQIFNRVGKRVFVMQSYDNSWPMNGEIDDLEQGVYFWVLTLRNPSGLDVEHRGHVTLLKNLD